MKKHALSVALMLLVALVSSVGTLAQTSTYLILQKAESSLGFYTPSGQHLASVPVGQHPHEFVISTDGRYAYTTDNGSMLLETPGQGGNTISIVDLVNRKKAGEIQLGQFRRPHGIDLDRKTGHLAISCELPDRLLIVDPVTRKVLRTTTPRAKLPIWSRWVQALCGHLSATAPQTTSLPFSCNPEK